MFIGFGRLGVGRKAIVWQLPRWLPPIAGISGKTLRGTTSCRPEPWPYKTKKYGLANVLFDSTFKRFDENTKVIVVEGLPGVGKSQLAQELAEELEMLYIPAADMDMYYINRYGYDMRELDAHLPPSCRSYDIVDFCLHPDDKRAANYQIQMYTLRFIQYCDALAHVLNTGQGVVMNRCVYSDFVFLEAMFESKYVSCGARSVYYDIVDNTIGELLRPHLVIYLDIPVEMSLQRVKSRAVRCETTSVLFTQPDFVSVLEYYYKQEYLKKISTHAQLLIYDWSGCGDTEVVVEDIETINFSQFISHDPKLKDWRRSHDWDWAAQRIKFTSQRTHLLSLFNVPRFDVPELLIEPYDAKQFKYIWFSAPGMEYQYGYNASMNDCGILTKTKIED